MVAQIRFPSATQPNFDYTVITYQDDDGDGGDGDGGDDDGDDGDGDSEEKTRLVIMLSFYRNFLSQIGLHCLLQSLAHN